MREFLSEYKIEHGCADCGYNEHAAALHFDHVRGEKVCILSKARSWEALHAELAKCDVRCANCHAVRGFEAGHHRSHPKNRALAA